MTDTAFLVPNGKVARLAQPFAKDPVTGNPVALLDVTVPPKNDAGGAGTAGTATDYARFSQMLLNGGQLEGVRLLGRATVAQMSADHLGDIKVASPVLARGYGFGLGFAVSKETGLNSMTGSPGEYRWGGAGGTAFWVDPKEQMVVVWMTQGRPGRGAARTGTCSGSSCRRRSSTEPAKPQSAKRAIASSGIGIARRPFGSSGRAPSRLGARSLRGRGGRRRGHGVLDQERAAGPLVDPGAHSSRSPRLQALS